MATGPTRQDWNTKTVQVTVSIYPRDEQMVTELREYLGASRSDVHRTAIRTLYVKLLGKDA